jgi:hypothetical protein
VPWFLLLLVVASLAGGWNWWTSERSVHRAPGVLAPEEPRQRNLAPEPQFTDRGYTFTQRAQFDLTARVLRKEIYRIDGGAALAPVDLGVGWGPMSDSAIVDEIEFSQMGRFLYWRPRDAQAFPLPPEMLTTHAAQMHMIPATKDIEHRLKRLRPGQLVTVGGYLVDIRGPRGFTWRTSMTRTDTGGGACEIVWVESLDVQ